MEIKYLQVLIMPNGEILCCGKTLGWATNKAGDKTLADYLFTKAEVADAKE